MSDYVVANSIKAAGSSIQFGLEALAKAIEKHGEDTKDAARLANGIAVPRL
jgi:hypothetical protein